MAMYNFILFIYKQSTSLISTLTFRKMAGGGILTEAFY